MNNISVGRKQLPVIGAADENYARYLLAAFLSALDNAKNKDELLFFCIDGGIESKTRKFMKALMKDRGGDLSFLNIDESEYEGYEVIKNLSKVAYYRISIPDIFHGKSERAIYIDCDTLVLGDIAELKVFPMSGKILGAVEDASRSSHKKSGVGKENFFNSGVLLIDIDGWVGSGFKERVMRALEKNEINNDQCALNVAANGDWVRLPLGWNYQIGLYRNKKDMRGRYGIKEFESALCSPSLIHFVGVDKPWREFCHHPWRDSYLPYMKIVSPGFEYAQGFGLFLSALGSYKEFKRYFLGVFRRLCLLTRSAG